MSVPIFQRGEPRRPFRGIGESLGQGLSQGINQGVEQDVIGRLLQNINQQQQDPLTAILGSNLPAARQNELVTAFQNQEKIRDAREEANQKAIQQRAETERKGQVNDFIDSLLGRTTTGSSTQEQPGASPSERSFLNESPNPQVQGPTTNNSRIGLADLTDDQLGFLNSHSDPRVRSLGEFEGKNRERTEKRFLSDRDFNTKASKKFDDKITDSRNPTRQKVSAGKQLVSAIETGDTGVWSANNLARITGIDAFRDASGQQFLTAGKEYFLANLERVKGRPNQFLEQQLLSALPQLGQKKNAQMVAAKMALADSQIGQAEIDIYDRIKQEDLRTKGFVGADAEQRTQKELGSMVDDIEKNLAYDIRKLQEQDLGIEKVQKRLLNKVPQGSVVTPSTLALFIKQNNGDGDKAIAQAKRLGWIVPTADEFRRYEGQSVQEGGF